MEKDKILNTGKKAVVGSIWLSISQYVNFVVNFGGGIVLARLLMPEHFGIVALALSIITIVYMFAGWGFKIAIIKENENLNKVAGTLFTILLIMNGCLLGIIFLMTLWLKRVYNSEVIIALFILAPANFLRLISLVHAALIEKYMQFKKVALIMMTSAIISTTMGIILAVINFGVWSLIWKEVIFAVIIACGNFLLCPSKVKIIFDKEIAKSFLKFGKDIFYNNIFESGLTKIDKVVVGSFL